MFGIGKGVFEAQIAVIGSTFLLLHFLIQWLYLLVNLTSGDTPVKQNRVYKPRERLSMPVLASRSLTLAGSFFISLSLWEIDRFFAIGLGGFFLLTLVYLGFWIILVKNFLSGNNPAFRKSAFLWLAAISIGHILIIVAAFIKLPTPTDANFVSISVGALLAIFILLADLYLSVIAPNPVARQLINLRDDIVFRRLGLNEALLSYRRIREGRLFMEEVAPELAALDAKLDERFRNFETMRGIAQRIDSLLPEAGSADELIASALETTTPYFETFRMARSNVDRINAELVPISQALADKADKVQVASGDVDSRHVMDTYVDGKYRYFREEFEKLSNETNRLDEKKRQLEVQLANSRMINSSTPDE